MHSVEVRRPSGTRASGVLQARASLGVDQGAWLLGQGTDGMGQHAWAGHGQFMHGLGMDSSCMGRAWAVHAWAGHGQGMHGQGMDSS